VVIKKRGPSKVAAPWKGNERSSCGPNLKTFTDYHLVTKTAEPVYQSKRRYCSSEEGKGGKQDKRWGSAQKKKKGSWSKGEETARQPEERTDLVQDPV